MHLQTGSIDMRMILTFQLEDDTKLNVICDCSNKASARATAIQYSQMIFSQRKFVLKADSKVVSFEKWAKGTVTKQTYGNKEFSVAAIKNGDVAINKVCAGSPKGAYNNIKYMYGIDGEVFAFIYDMGQMTKKKSALSLAKNTMTDKNKTANLLNQAADCLRQIPGIGVYADDLNLLFSMIQDYIRGVYKQVPMNVIIKSLVILLYFISPVNLSFEAVPVIGQCDDIVLIGWLLNGLHDDLMNYKKWSEEKRAKLGFGNKKYA